MTLLSCRAPSGDEAKFASPDKIAGTAASTVFCVVAGSNPNADAILTMRLGVRNCVRAERMFADMVGSSIKCISGKTAPAECEGAAQAPDVAAVRNGVRGGVCAPAEPA